MTEVLQPLLRSLQQVVVEVADGIDIMEHQVGLVAEVAVDLAELLVAVEPVDKEIPVAVVMKNKVEVVEAPAKQVTLMDNNMVEMDQHLL
jgi:hypothetical protein